MPDRLDELKESARHRAKRRWDNHRIQKEYLEEKHKEKPKQAMPAKEPLIIENDGRVNEVKFETAFKKEIRAMFDEQKNKALELYKLHLKAMRYKLLKEKLRRLEAIAAQRESERKKRDLFA